MSNCLFCRLVANEIPSYTLYEDGYTRAFLDIEPCAPGHTMVILKKHGLTILDYSKEELGNLFASAQKVIQALTKTFKTDVFTIGINHGEEAGVHHLHVHIIPRFPDDRGGVIQSIVHKEAKVGLTDIQRRIVENIK